MRVAILGTGNIGTDLLVKCLRSGLVTGIEAIERAAGQLDLVFDATSADAHLRHAPILRRLGLRSIDMTPSQLGKDLQPQDLSNLSAGGG